MRLRSVAACAMSAMSVTSCTDEEASCANPVCLAAITSL